MEAMERRKIKNFSKSMKILITQGGVALFLAQNNYNKEAKKNPRLTQYIWLACALALPKFCLLYNIIRIRKSAKLLIHVNIMQNFTLLIMCNITLKFSLDLV